MIGLGSDKNGQNWYLLDADFASKRVFWVSFGKVKSAVMTIAKQF